MAEAVRGIGRRPCASDGGGAPRRQLEEDGPLLSDNLYAQEDPHAPDRSYGAPRQHGSHFDQIEADRTELVVTRQNREPMVIMALPAWDGLRETLHLLSSPANAERLRRSIAALDGAKAKTATR